MWRAGPISLVLLGIVLRRDTLASDERRMYVPLAVGGEPKELGRRVGEVR